MNTITDERLAELTQECEAEGAVDYVARKYGAVLPAGELLSVLRELQQRREAEQWRDIRTAPMDGTRILIADIDDQHQYRWMYVSRMVDGSWQIVGNAYDREAVWLASHPTHWMPLPAAPRDSASLRDGEMGQGDGK